MKERIAALLLNEGAVFLRPEEPFIWASGIKSPVYCDNRLILTAPKARKWVEQGMAAALTKEFPEAEVLMGTSTAGIPHAAIVAHLTGLPMGYVRSQAKDHGRENLIEGKLIPGQKVVVIEDLISTGGSALATVKTLEDAGAQVLGILCIFEYGIRALPVKTVSLCDLDVLTEVAVRKKYITREQKKEVLEWKSGI